MMVVAHKQKNLESGFQKWLPETDFLNRRFGVTAVAVYCSFFLFVMTVGGHSVGWIQY